MIMILKSMLGRKILFTSLHIGHTKIVEYGSSDASRGAIVAITSPTT